MGLPLKCWVARPRHPKIRSSFKLSKMFAKLQIVKNLKNILSNRVLFTKHRQNCLGHIHYTPGIVCK